MLYAACNTGSKSASGNNSVTDNWEIGIQMWTFRMFTLEEALKKELDKVGDKFMPRQHYIDKWKYKLTKGGFIDYSEGAEFQGPDLNR